ncbi:MAG: hypothetical protein AAFO69_06120 [Bacteroidota bacterium]
MTTIEDIMAINLAKIENPKLRERVKNLLLDYEKASNKAIFIEETQNLINMVMSTVQRFAPEALTKEDEKDPKPKKDEFPRKRIEQLHGLLLDNLNAHKKRNSNREDELTDELNKVINSLESAFDDYESHIPLTAVRPDLVTFLQWSVSTDFDKSNDLIEQVSATIKALLIEFDIPFEPENNSGEGGAIEIYQKQIPVIIGELEDIMQFIEENKAEEGDETIEVLAIIIDDLKNASEQEKEELIHEALEKYREWSEKTSFGDEVEQELKRKRKVDQSINEILEELGMETMPEKKHKAKPKPSATDEQTTILTKELVERVINELDSIKATDLDQTIVETTLDDLKAALEKEIGKSFVNSIEKAVANFNDYAVEIEDTAVQKQAVAAMNKLVKALGQPMLDDQGNSTAETKAERNKRIKRELEALAPEIEQCEHVFREAARLKREITPKKKKPAPSIYEQLQTKIYALTSLIPATLKDDVEVQQLTMEAELTFFRLLIKAWELTEKRKANKVEKEIEGKFEATEEKIQRDSRKETAAIWKEQLSELKIKQKDKLDKDQYTAFIVKFEALQEARRLYVDSPDQARKLLKKELTDTELKKYIKKNILDEIIN